MRPPHSLGGGGEGECEQKGAALSWRAVYLDLAAMSVHYPEHHRHPQPDALAGRLGGEEGIKDF